METRALLGAERGLLSPQNASMMCTTSSRTKTGPDFKNEAIRLADLAGKAHAMPEADQAYPMGFEQQRDLYMKRSSLCSPAAKENPVLMEILNNYQNRGR